ncbi:hypothetical protein [Roseomonas fluvialis]|uniref:hypothetical protein n=1 Tax=Roseomonas fluvialis TaxID=1750527 RepID=UPI001FCBCDE8|nr:hypothetical protein [Roseomonas fluvialis]
MLDFDEAMPRHRYRRVCASTGAPPPHDAAEDEDPQHDAAVIAINPHAGEQTSTGAEAAPSPRHAALADTAAFSFTARFSAWR